MTSNSSFSVPRGLPRHIRSPKSHAPVLLERFSPTGRARMRNDVRCAIIICFVSWIVGAGSSYAATWTVDLPDFVRPYGGIDGEIFEATTYDFDTAFMSIASATLHLEGNTGIGGVSDAILSFNVALEGVTTPEVNLLVEGPTSSDPPFMIDIPLVFDANVLGGRGPITMSITTTACCDLETFVETASLTFEGIPEPSTLTLAFLALAGLLAHGWRHGRA